MKMAWGKWCQGLIVSTSQGVLTGLTAGTILPAEISVRQLVMISALPTLITFFSFLAHTPPPLGANGNGGAP